MSDWSIEVVDWNGQRYVYDLEEGAAYNQEANQVGTMNFSMPTNPISNQIHNGYDVYLKWRGMDVFGGKIKDRSRNKTTTTYHCEDWLGSLARRNVTHRFYSDTKAESIIQTLVSQYLDGFSFDMEASNTSLQWQAENQSILRMAQDIAGVTENSSENIGYLLGVKPDKTIFFRSRGYQKYSGSLPLEDFELQESAGDIVNKVITICRPGFSFPSTGDDWTEGTADHWTPYASTMSDQQDSLKGVWSIRSTYDGTDPADQRWHTELNMGGQLNLSDWYETEFAIKFDSGLAGKVDRIAIYFIDSGANYYYKLWSSGLPAANTWKTFRAKRSTDFSTVGSPSWTSIEKIYIQVEDLAGGLAANEWFQIDSFHLKFAEIKGTANDTDSEFKHWGTTKHFTFTDIIDTTTAQVIATNLLERYKEQSISISGTVEGFIPIELGEYVEYDDFGRTLHLVCTSIGMDISADGSVKTSLTFGVPPLSVERIVVEAVKNQPWHASRQSAPPLASVDGEEIRDLHFGVAITEEASWGTYGPCVGDCQVSCQSSCQTNCQSACEVSSCQTSCQVTSCQVDCMTAVEKTICGSDCLTSIVGGRYVT
ncbi:MAG: hypothetical protein ACE5OZ_23150 [Candidatus Heimdallarchaeota archaeon]